MARDDDPSAHSQMEAHQHQIIVTVLVSCVLPDPLFLSCPLTKRMSCSSSSCAPSSSLLPKSLPDSSRSSVDSAQALEPVRTDDPPALKAETVHLPLRLPPPPLAQPDIDLKSLVVDPEHRDRPIGFVIGRIKSLGSSSLTNPSTYSRELTWIQALSS